MDYRNTEKHVLRLTKKTKAQLLVNIENQFQVIQGLKEDVTAAQAGEKSFSDRCKVLEAANRGIEDRAASLQIDINSLNEVLGYVRKSDAEKGTKIESLEDEWAEVDDQLTEEKDEHENLKEKYNKMLKDLFISEGKVVTLQNVVELLINSK